MLKKQVDSSHYNFTAYMSKNRWISVWHQLDEVQRLASDSILELGPGPGLFKLAAAQFGMKVETLDIDPELNPDHVASVTKMPFEVGSYDVVCAFQMLEHLRYEDSLRAFSEMVRVSKRYIVISLPDSRRVWRYLAHLPKFGMYECLFPRPQLRAPTHEFDGEHYWEISKRGFDLKKILKDLSTHAELLKTYRVSENPYHRFFIFTKKNS